jgi:subtilisin family serine protease
VRRALDTEGVGDEVHIGREIVRAAMGGAEIINLSLGLVTTDDEPPVALESAIRTAVKVAREKHDTHLLVVCAAGNYGDDHPCWPAAFAADPDLADHVVSVAALRRDYDDPTEIVPAEWSTYFDGATFCTLGQGIVSTYVVGKEAPSNDPLGPDVFGPSSWATWSGTSFAAPQITGAIVRLVQELNLTTKEALGRLKEECGKRIEGYGLPIEILPV